MVQEPMKWILTVVMPAYNEEEAIADAVDDVRRHVLDVIPDSMLLVVNDGSKDRTGQVLDELKQKESRLMVIHKPNGGHGPAIMTGLDAARSKYVFLVDSDLQIPLSAFGPLWQAVQQGEAQASFGVRRRRNDPQLRLWLTKFIRTLLPIITGAKLYDANVPYKLVPVEAWRQARKHIPDGTLAPSLFLAVYMKRHGYRIAEFDVPHAERQTGEVSIKRMKLLKFCWRAFKQLIAFRRSL